MVLEQRGNPVPRDDAEAEGRRLHHGESVQAAVAEHLQGSHPAPLPGRADRLTQGSQDQRGQRDQGERDHQGEGRAPADPALQRGHGGQRERPAGGRQAAEQALRKALPPAVRT